MGLKLTRKVNQTIRIGDDITISVHHVGRKRVMLDVDAPPHVDVHRGEVKEAIDAGEAVRRTPAQKARAAGL